MTEEQIWQMIALDLAGALSINQQKTFQEWRNQDIRNEKLYQEMLLLWNSKRLIFDSKIAFEKLKKKMK